VQQCPSEAAEFFGCGGNKFTALMPSFSEPVAQPASFDQFGVPWLIGLIFSHHFFCKSDIFFISPP
jgi:hypothetical protein